MIVGLKFIIFVMFGLIQKNAIQIFFIPILSGRVNPKIAVVVLEALPRFFYNRCLYPKRPGCLSHHVAILILYLFFQ